MSFALVAHSSPIVKLGRMIIYNLTGRLKWNLPEYIHDPNSFNFNGNKATLHNFQHNTGNGLNVQIGSIMFISLSIVLLGVMQPRGFHLSSTSLYTLPSSALASSFILHLTQSLLIGHSPLL